MEQVWPPASRREQVQERAWRLDALRWEGTEDEGVGGQRKQAQLSLFFSL